MQILLNKTNSELANSRFLEKAIIIYITIQILGILLSNFIVFQDRISTIWIINSIGFTIFSVAIFSRFSSKRLTTWIIAFLYIVTQLLTLLIHIEYLFGSLKSFGLNINIIVTAVYMVMVFSLLNQELLIMEQIKKIYIQIYIWGLIACLFSIVTEHNTIAMVLNSKIGAYSVATRSFFDNKNTYGAFLAMALIAGIFLYQHTRRKRFLFGETFLFVCLILSFSRAALLLFGVFCIVFFAFKENRSPFLNRLMLVVFLGCCIMIILNSTFRSLLFEKIIRSDVGDAGRSIIWHYVFKIFNRNWYNIPLGIGFSELNMIGISYIHNIYLEIYFVGGIVKLLFFLAALIRITINIMRTFHRNSFTGYLGVSVFIAYLGYGFFESVIIFELGIIPFLIILNMLIIPQTSQFKIKLPAILNNKTR